MTVQREDGKPATLIGYPIVWNVLSDDRGGYKVRLAPGSATFADPTRAIYHHEFADILGTTQNNSIRFAADDFGIKVEIDLPNTTLARDTAALIADGYVKGMSFAMVEMPWGWGSSGPIAIPGRSKITSEGGFKVITATKYLVDEVTITPIPAFTETSIDLKYAAKHATVPHPLRTAHSNRLAQLKFASLTLSSVV